MPRTDRYNAYKALARTTFAVSIIVMYAGVGKSFLPSSNRAEANVVWTYFFSAWLLALALVLLTRALMIKARRYASGMGRRNGWTDAVVVIQAVICGCYLLWGLSARIQGR